MPYYSLLILRPSEVILIQLITETQDAGSCVCMKRVSLRCDMRDIKGDLLCKNHFYKVFEHSCVAAVCENNQPIMVKIHQLFFLIKSINHKQSLRTSCFRSSLCSHHRGEKVPHICDALCSISINTALSEKQRSAITGVIYNVSTKEALQVLCFGMH